jgi:monofunctional biosynthetic peptidoglycan transglycosylase
MLLRSLQKIDKLQLPIRKHKRVSIENISPYMVYAVIAAEDNKFVSHFGFDVTALQKAIEYNLSTDGSLL